MVSSDGDAFNRGVNDLSMCYSQDMCYRCHRPGNASSSDEGYMDRAQDMYELISVS